MNLIGNFGDIVVRLTITGYAVFSQFIGLFLNGLQITYLSSMSKRVLVVLVTAVSSLIRSFFSNIIALSFFLISIWNENESSHYLPCHHEKKVITYVANLFQRSICVGSLRMYKSTIFLDIMYYNINLWRVKELLYFYTTQTKTYIFNVQKNEFCWRQKFFVQSSLPWADSISVKKSQLPQFTFRF